MVRAQKVLAEAVRFGAILRRIRLEKGWTIRKLAQRSGMNPAYLGIVESGGNLPSLTAIIELCEVLGVDVGDVVREVAQRTSSAATSS
jgi:transcriptional regulator with XRE-family HTH domain